MKIYTVEIDGINHSYYATDNTDDPTTGIEIDIPDLKRVDWSDIKLKLHNELHNANLFTQTDVNDNKGFKALHTVVSKVVFETLYQLYINTPAQT